MRTFVYIIFRSLGRPHYYLRALERRVIVLELGKPALLFQNSGKEVIIDIIKQCFSFRAHQGGRLEHYCRA